eukprot:m.54311 g.54311  ORF g.54311 m.54311 type:complete len:195 (+) comp11408_c1_seq1:325-909(+)
MYGEAGADLLRELQRAAEFLVPFYNEENVARVVAEINGLCEETKRTFEEYKEGDSLQDPRVASSIAIHFAAVNRNIRCVLAYLHERLDRLKRIRWELGAVLPPYAQANTSDAEKTTYREYSKLLSTYMADVGIDLTRNLTPPKELDIKVRVLSDDVGEVETETGETLALAAGSEHLVRRTDVEQLIRQGQLEQL